MFHVVPDYEKSHLSMHSGMILVNKELTHAVTRCVFVVDVTPRVRDHGLLRTPIKTPNDYS